MFVSERHKGIVLFSRERLDVPPQPALDIFIVQLLVLRENLIYFFAEKVTPVYPGRHHRAEGYVKKLPDSVDIEHFRKLVVWAFLRVGAVLYIGRNTVADAVL